MTPSKISSCIWRGEEGDGTSFECLHPENRKRVTPHECSTCPLRVESHLVVPANPEQAKENRGETNQIVHESNGAVSYLATGAVGLSKALLGIDRAPDELIQERWEICQKCEFYRMWRCTKCGCIASQKAKVLSEKCPENFWPA